MGGLIGVLAIAGYVFFIVLLGCLLRFNRLSEDE